MIKSEQVEKALNYLASTDEDFGKWRGHVKGLEYRLKMAKAQSFMDAQGNVAEREAQSVLSENFKALVNEHEEAWIKLSVIEAKRERACLTIEVWRTEESSRRKGNV